MKLLFLAVFLAAVAVQVWRRLAQETRAAIITKAKTMFAKAASALTQAQRTLRAKVFRRRTAYRNALLTEKGDLNPAGRIIIAHLTKFCYLLNTTAQGEADRDTMMRREGRRQVIIEIMRELSLDPAQALQAVREEDLLSA